jgi:PAS domain S-box-containing protein
MTPGEELSDPSWEVLRKKAENKCAQTPAHSPDPIGKTREEINHELLVQSGDVFFNERWEGIIGYTLAELAPVSIDTWINLCHPDDLQRSDDLLKNYFSKLSPMYECEARLFHKDGHWVWVLSSGKVVEWDINGLPVRMTGTLLDITRRK